MSEALISVRSLCKWYGAWCALDHVSLEVRAGSCTVLCGPSGSGKSTLLRCLNGLEEWEAGDVIIGGCPVARRARDLRRLRREVGMVFQSFNLFPHLDALANVTIAPRVVGRQRRADAERAGMALLARVGLADQARKLPADLSGGQQQRVAIARALAMAPRALLFDEPTSALDPESIKEVLDIMVELAESGTTMVVVTHEMGFARHVAHNVIFMDRGRIVEAADPASFFKAPASERARAFLGEIGATPVA
ncbi:amino acid ABC transporter ATP-binding protein [Pelagibius marinus]|uniref:amino acid ABC transporter ATP-binding protein n=1 Tax=Pelagibius marinus TaxID=2762760 RepID=UPI0029C9D25C|nr:amino acid ABC transporter ATP-binding protein [Pelagibius marinus]